ncbi:hypothetical protein FVE85_1117 [Porphyridium purpureum]|uniref:Uncharacterized protein n=1 Tax=Porphyridium purpureum TaxID=35688 RepID=A0A5J4Z242_PORPP|nr:hypothetical protein FVE85_1117 [Porphyridium purpureum]|eukprot:POR1914..scf208_2
MQIMFRSVFACRGGCLHTFARMVTLCMVSRARADIALRRHIGKAQSGATTGANEVWRAQDYRCEGVARRNASLTLRRGDCSVCRVLVCRATPASLLLAPTSRDLASKWFTPRYSDECAVPYPVHMLPEVQTVTSGNAFLRPGDVAVRICNSHPCVKMWARSSRACA